MTDREVTYRAMTPQVRQKLKNPRLGWKPVAPRLVPAHEQVIKLPGAFDTSEAPLSSASNQGCTAAKARAKDTGVAARRVAERRRTPQPTHYRSALTQMAGYQKLKLTGLRHKNLMPALESLARWAAPVAAQRADARVTATQLKALAAATTAYRLLLGTPYMRAVGAACCAPPPAWWGSSGPRSSPATHTWTAWARRQILPAWGPSASRPAPFVDAGHIPGPTAPHQKTAACWPNTVRLPAGLEGLRRRGHMA